MSLCHILSLTSMTVDLLLICTCICIFCLIMLMKLFENGMIIFKFWAVCKFYNGEKESDNSRGASE